MHACMQTHTPTNNFADIFLQKHLVLKHIQHKYVFHVSLTNSNFSCKFTLPCLLSRLCGKGGWSFGVCLCVREKRLGSSVQGPVSLGSTLKYSTDLPISFKCRSWRGVRGHLEQQDVSVWSPCKQVQIRSLNTAVLWFSFFWAGGLKMYENDLVCGYSVSEFCRK